MVRILNIAFEDDEFTKLRVAKAKSTLNWKQFIMLLTERRKNGKRS